MERRKIRRQHGERGRDDKVVMAVSRLQSHPATHTRLENELTQFTAQKLTPGRMVRDRQLSAPYRGAEPLDQPRLADDQAVSLR